MAAPALGAAAKALGRRALLKAALSRRSDRGRNAGCACAVALVFAIAVAGVVLVASVVAMTTPLAASSKTAASRSLAEWGPPITCARLQVSQGYGDTPYEHPHTGIDLVCPGGTPVAAIASGVFRQRQGAPVACVFPSGARGGLGSYGELDIGEAAVLYGHLAGFAVPDGTPVTAGTILGYEGTSGCSTGFHLHFEVHFAGRVTNPCPFLPQGYPAAHDTGDARCWGSAPP